jgi:hypothetical protein
MLKWRNIGSVVSFLNILACLMSDATAQNTCVYWALHGLFSSPIFRTANAAVDRLCDLVVRVLGYRSGGPGLIPGTTRKKKIVCLERGPLNLESTTEKLLDRKVAAHVYKTENTAVGISHADHVTPSIRRSWQSLRRQVEDPWSDSSLADSDHGVFFNAAEKQFGDKFANIVTSD